MLEINSHPAPLGLTSMKRNFAVRFLFGFLCRSLLVACAIGLSSSTSAAQSSAQPDAASTPCQWKGRTDQETQKLCDDAAQWAATHPQAEPTPCPYTGTDRFLWEKYCNHQDNLDPKVIDDIYKNTPGVPMPSNTYVTMPDGTIVGSDGSVIVPQNPQ
jgi:hypothetical protein